jgi:hypothetical protein
MGILVGLHREYLQLLVSYLGLLPWYVNNSLKTILLCLTLSRIILIHLSLSNTCFKQIIAIRNICLKEPILFDILLYASIAALLCEGNNNTSATVVYLFY